MKIYTLVTHLVSCKSGKCRYIIYRIDKIILHWETGQTCSHLRENRLLRQQLKVL